METETEIKQYEIIAGLKLTEQQVNQALAQYVLNNEELKELIGSKRVMILPKWQTTASPFYASHLPRCPHGRCVLRNRQRRIGGALPDGVEGEPQ